MKACRPLPRPAAVLPYNSEAVLCTVKGPYLSRYGPFIQLFKPSAAIRPR